MSEYNNENTRPAESQQPTRVMRSDRHKAQAQQPSISARTASQEPAGAVRKTRTEAPRQERPAAAYSERPERPVKQGKAKKDKKGLRAIGRLLLLILTTVLGIAGVVITAVAIIINGPSVTARNTFVTTVLESGKLKFVASVFLSKDEIDEIVNGTSMGEMKTDIDTDLIETGGEVEGNFDENGIEVIPINGRSYYATLMVVKDPSKVKCASTYPWAEYGKTMDEIVKKSGAIAGVNGGLYASNANKGGRPYGVCVVDGQIQLNDPSGWRGLYMIGMDKNNLLRIESMSGWSKSRFETFVKEEGIRDAVAFQDETSDKNNHFVPLIINGEPRELNGTGSGSNPRTVIGQRADGAILLLVTDGRGSAGHLGATAQDLIDIMLDYGAVNAANLDGGSSSCMYYKDAYLMTSVTLYYANSSWRLPTAFVVMGGN